MSLMRRVVIGAAVTLFVVWMGAHWNRLTGDADALIRFTLGALFAVLIIGRRKAADEQPFHVSRRLVPLFLVTGVVATLGGLIFEIHIVEWIGILLLLFACSVWVAPSRFGPDLILAFFVLFWMHPLPGQIFGWMQGAMQRLSVMGSELVLHAANVRVWADGLVLRTGYQAFLVPEACSGMRTAVTVFLCTLGVSLLLRLKWYEIVAFVVLGLVQVLLFNIARISYMVLWAPRMPPEWANTFLHDSLGIFLMGAILLVQLEASWWCWWSRRRKRIKEGIRKRELEAPDKASVVPHALRRLGYVLVILVAVGFIGFGIFGVIYKSRAYHRKEMIREVAEGLMDSNPGAADRAIKQALRLVPGNPELLSMQARTDFVRGRIEEGLAILDAKVAAGDALDLEEQILKCWALMRIGRISAAAEIVATFGPETERIPGVAMLKAEFSAMNKRPEDAARYVVLASRSHRMLRRIRALFPYLALHEQWAAIADADHDRPYEERFQALIAVRANQKVADLAGVARVLGQAIKSWPEDPRFLRDLYQLARRRPGSDWEARFERNLKANLSRLSADMLATLQDYCWQLGRPDLAWIVFRKLQKHDANDPALLLAPARHGHAWCRFRRHEVNVEAEDSGIQIDLLPVLKLFSDCAPFQAFCERIPLFEVIEDAIDPNVRKTYLTRCLQELEKRESGDGLSGRLQRLYPVVLAMAMRYDEAHARLDIMLERNPDLESDILLQHAVFYDQEGDWEEAYEALRRHSAVQELPSLTAYLLTIKAMMNINQGVCAVEVLDEARAAFPGSRRLELAEAAIWDVFGFKEQALKVLPDTPRAANSPTCVGLLYDTGRIQAARTLSEALGIPMPRRIAPQQLRLAPATFSVARRWPEPFSDEARAERIAALKTRIEEADSPFLEHLYAMECDWHATQMGALEPWEAGGRDPRERVAALYRLTMLAAQDRQYAVAEAALRRCLEYMPDSPVLWRALLGVTEGDADVVAAAYERCPEDPEVWLANIVVKSRATVEAVAATNAAGTDAASAVETASSAGWSWATNRVAEAIERDVFAPGTLVRAADYLLWRGQTALAARLAKHAIPRSRGLLPACVLGVRVALRQRDLRWAESCAIAGVANAQNPTPFYKALVDIKAATRQMDSDLLDALEYLTDRETEQSRWAETLGRVYFQKGDMKRALSIFDSVLKGDTRNVSVQTMMLAAEAARREARTDRAVRILEAAYAVQPERMSVLNNLVYMLAQNSRTLSRARALLPKLLEIGEGSFAVMDTAAVVYLRSGDMQQAQVWMDKAVAALEKDNYSANEVRLNAAELELRHGDYDAAREKLEVLRRESGRSGYIDRRARRLLRDIDSLQR